jgi:hypothetical protein
VLLIKPAEVLLFYTGADRRMPPLALRRRLARQTRRYNIELYHFAFFRSTSPARRDSL